MVSTWSEKMTSHWTFSAITHMLTSAVYDLVILAPRVLHVSYGLPYHTIYT